MNLKKFIDVAIEEAIKSNHPQHKVGCVIFDKNKIISKGRNYRQKSRKSITKKFISYPNSIHAEVSAIINAKTDLKNMSLLVIRINKKNELRLAKPCSYCLKYINYVGIKKVYYSISNYPYIIKEDI